MKKYEIIQNEQQLAEMDAYFEEGQYSLISVDTETNGLHFWKNLVIGISISTDRQSGFYIPFLTWKPDLNSKKSKKIKKIDTLVYENGSFECIWTGKKYPENVRPDEYEYPSTVLEVLKYRLYDQKPWIIMHNAPFDVLMIEKSLGFNLQDQIHVDTVLLKHVLDENTSMGLKETAILWAKDLEIPVEKEANREQIEMGNSVIQNDGKYGKKEKHIWRADLELMGKYAIADTALTFGLYEVGMDKLKKDYEQKHQDWFFDDEVMPLCREVIIPMKRHGVRIDVPAFQEMAQETKAKMDELEDAIHEKINSLTADFTVGESIDDVAHRKAQVEFFIREMGLEYPTKITKGVAKKTLEKKAVQKAFAETGHWLWGWLLGETELPFDEDQMQRFKQEIYEQKAGKRYRFSISSDAHLRWLFCTKLGHDPAALPQTDSANKEKIIPSMKAEVLKQFFLDIYPWIKKLLLYKKLDKLLGTYILPALELNNNGYLHMDFVQSGTTSGRFACRGGFNLQTLPKVEDVSKCRQCGSKDVIVIHPIKLVAVMQCNACEHLEEDILCPSAIKAAFIAPEGWKIVNADYSSLEPRAFAFVSGEQKLKDVYQKELDLYSKIYCDMEDKAGKYSPDPKAPNFLKKVANHLRDMVKPVVLGVVYGARGPQTAKLMGFKTKREDKEGNEIEVLDVERGSAFREKYLDTYPNLRRFMDGQDAKACGDGFVETLVGRRRHFKFAPEVYKLLQEEQLSIDEFLDLKKSELDKEHIKKTIFTLANLTVLSEKCGFNLVDEKKRIPRTWAFVRAMFKNELNNSKNMPIQGLGAHIANRAMLETARMLRQENLSGYVGLQVHDEITCFAPADEAEITSEILKIGMETNKYAMLVDVPMIAEPIIADCLKDAK